MNSDRLVIGTRASTISDAYSLAERELGEDAHRFRTALLAYSRAVDLEARARAEWEANARPLIQVHGAAGVHPLVKVMLETSRSAVPRGAAGVDAGEREAGEPGAASWPAGGSELGP